MARMLEHKDSMQYFDTRRQLLRQIEHYGVNRQINLEEVERIVSNADTIIDRYPLLREQLTEMRLFVADDEGLSFFAQTRATGATDSLFQPHFGIPPRGTSRGDSPTNQTVAPHRGGFATKLYLRMRRTTTGI